MGELEYDPITDAWVEAPTPTGLPSGMPDTSVVITAPNTTAPTTPMVDPHANDGLPGKPPCDPNGLYPTAHRCAAMQAYKDAQNVIRVVQTAAGTPPAVPSGDITQQLNKLGENAATWISQNATLVTAGVLGLLVFGTLSGGRGRR